MGVYMGIYHVFRHTEMAYESPVRPHSLARPAQGQIAEGLLRNIGFEARQQALHGMVPGQLPFALTS